jgi:hypothetical protein
MQRSIVALAAAAMLLVTACGDESISGAAAAPLASATASASPSPSPSLIPTVDPEGELCVRVGEMVERLTTLQSVELTLTNRTSLEIEFEKLRAAYEELERTDLGDRADELEDSLTRLGYRMGELKLGVEDFQTNPKPRRAAPHVEETAQKVADELSSFAILSRC